MRLLSFAPIVVASIAATGLFGQLAEHANEHYKTPEARANVARGLVGADRDARQRPKELLEVLAVRPGMVVADIGTGAGYLLPHLSSAVGTEGKVIAEDIFPDFLDQAKKRASSLGNVEFVLGDERSAKLPANSVDLALMLDVYHHVNHPKEVLASIAAGLKRGGRLAIVEFHQNDGTKQGMPGKGHVRFTAEEGVKEIESFGWKLVERKEFNPGIQWLAIFEKK